MDNTGLQEPLKAFLNKKTNIYGHLDRGFDNIDLDAMFSNEQFHAEFFEFLREFVPEFGDLKSKNALDLGCSCGPISFSFAPYFANIVGVDLEREAVSLADSYKKYKNVQNAVFIEGDAITLEQLPKMYDAYFDVVFLKDIVEHLGSKANFEAMLASLKRVIKKDTLIVVEAPNYLFPFEPHLAIPTLPKPSKPQIKLIGKLLGKLKNRDAHSFVDWLNLMSANELEESFKKHGFEIVANITEEWKLKKIFFGEYRLSGRYAFVGGVLKAMRRIGLSFLAYRFLRFAKFYPTSILLVKNV